MNGWDVLGWTGIACIVIVGVSLAAAIAIVVIKGASRS